MLPSSFFSNALLSWFDRYGRKNLPWQLDPSPYRVWVSEIMLQQTAVATVIPYYEKFMQHFPTLSVLARSSLDQLMHLWSGLGYYKRALYLHQTAQSIDQQYQGQFPLSVEKLMELPGIGRSTAGAIAALAMGLRAPILDGNVKRVLTRFYGIEGWPGKLSIEKKLWQLAESLLPQSRCDHYTQAMMDLGAILCKSTHPLCDQCPLQSQCIAYQKGEQSKYPSKREKKVRPIKEECMLLLMNQKNQILLHRQPNKGRWSGLWSLPAYNKNQNWKKALPQFSVIELQKIISWPSFRHTFSHYHLHITPVYAIASRYEIAKEDDSKEWQWYFITDLSSIGLPAPIKNYVSRMKNEYWMTS